MKKLLLILLCLPLLFTTCKKEGIDPSNNTNVNNTDTITVNNTDTTTNNTGIVTVISPSQTLPFSHTTTFGEGYDVTRAEFEINCSEQTNLTTDISYSYVSTNYLSLTANLKQYGNGFIAFYSEPDNPFINGEGMMGRFATTTYPKNSNDSTTHALEFQEQMMLNYIKSYSYTPGILNLDLLSYQCGGDSTVVWSVQMIVTEYSDGIIELSIDQGPNTTLDGQITWDSHLKLTLEKNF
jgi:hypothetical protein